MSNVTFGKTEVVAMCEVLDEDYDSIEDAARAVLKKAAELYEKRAKFTVVGQIVFDGRRLDPSDPEAAKLSLGAYSTKGTARAAAESLVLSQTGEEARAWILDTFHGSPAAFYRARKEAKELAAQGLSNADKFNHITEWLARHPDKSRDDYPGPPKPDPRSNCPICGAPPLEED